MSSKNIYERFLWFDRKARARQYPNATSLAAKFEVSVKTAQRDIEFMRDRLDCPLRYDQSRKGYCYEDETFSLPSFYISSEELAALLVARNMLRGISASHIGEEFSALTDRITAILRERLDDAAIIDDAVSVRQIAYVPPPEKIFRAVLEGCMRQRQLELVYCSPARDQETGRRVDPFHLFNYMGTWHLVGYCHLRRGIRDFNLARIRQISILDEQATRKGRFDVREYFGSAFGLYKGYDISEVTLRFTPEKARWVKDQVWHRDQKKEMLPDGSLELTFPVADFAEISMEVLRHGSGVRVISPPELRDRIRDEAKKIAGLYGK